MPLYDLPNETLFSVADFILQRDLNAFVRTSRQSHQRLNPYLYQRNIKEGGLRTFFWAVENRKHMTARNFLDAGLDPNARENWTYRGATPLHWASFNGESWIAARLIERGADIEAEDYRGYTPFQLAIEKNRASVVWVLIAHGVDGRHTHFDNFESGYTALHVASYLGFPEIVSLLLDAGEDVEARESCGLTPLHLAAKPSKDRYSGRTAEGVFSTVKVLLHYGANLDAKADDGLRPVDCMRDHWDINIRSLLKNKALYRPP